MMPTKLTLLGLALVAAGIAATGACNSVGECPADQTTIQDGVACSGDGLQCAFDVTYAACDGTKQTISSSCTCSGGAWSCPSVPDCDAGVEEAGDDAQVDAGDDACTDCDAAADVSADAPAEAASDAGDDGSSTDAASE